MTHRDLLDDRHLRRAVSGFLLIAKAVTCAVLGSVALEQVAAAGPPLLVAQEITIAGSDPIDLAVDSTGVVYILDASDATVRTFAPLNHAPTGSFPVPDPAVSWAGIAVAESPTRLIFIDADATQWVETALDGGGAVATPITAPRPDTRITGLSFDPDDGTLWAVDAANDVIDQYSPQGGSTGVSIASPAALLPGFGTVDGGVAAAAGSDCLTVSAGTFAAGEASTRFRIDPSSGVIPVSAPWSALGVPAVRGLAIEPLPGSSERLYAITTNPSTLWVIEGSESCDPCATAPVGSLAANSLPGSGIDLSWTAPLNGGTIRIVRDGVGLVTLPPGTSAYLDSSATGFHIYEVATTVAGLGCPGPLVAANLIPADTFIAPGLVGMPLDVTVAPALGNAYILDASLGGSGVLGVQIIDLALNPVGQISPPVQGSSYTGLAYDDGGTPIDPTDDLLHWRNETQGLIQSTDLMGMLIAEFFWSPSTGGATAGLDLADLDCGTVGFVARDVATQTLHFFDSTGTAIGTPIALSSDPDDFGSGVASIAVGAGTEVLLGSTPPGFVDAIISLDCAGAVTAEESIGPTRPIPVADAVAIALYLDPLSGAERRMLVTNGGAVLTCGVEPRPCDDPDGVPCDLDFLPGCVEVHWSEPVSYTTVEVWRNSTVIATYPGGATTMHLDCPTVSATYGYSVVGVCAATGTRTVQIPLCKLCVGGSDGKHRIADLDRGGLNDSAAAIEAAITGVGGEVSYCADLEPGALDDAPSIWVLLGTFPDNHVLTPAEGAALAEYATLGIPIYIEGGDVWGFDAPTEFACFDGVADDLATDAIGPLTQLEGANQLAGFTTSYTADQAVDDLNDGLVPATSDLLGSQALTVPVWNSVAGGVSQPVALLTQGGAVQVFASSFELGGVAPADRELIAQEVYFLLTTHGDFFFTRGECNQDGMTNIADAIFLLSALFQGTAPPECEKACDANDDGMIDIADPIMILTALFGGGVLPQPSSCGADPTFDPLSGDCPACP